MSNRELPDWITAYLRYTENSEPPRSYHHWLAASIVAGALQRKVKLVWGFETIYPNLFLILVGQSGRTRKGVALGIAKNLLLQTPNVHVAPEAASREAIIGAMKRALTNYTDPEDGVIQMHCSLTAYSEELAVFLGQGDIKLLANLTDWYDSKNEWAYETIGRGRDALQGLCFNLAGATAPDWLQSMLPQEAVGGGFTSRVIFVVEESKGKTIPKHQLTREELELEELLKRDLERIQQLGGQYTFEPDGEDAYVRWYKEQDSMMAAGKFAVSDPRFAGYCERRATHLRKLMMIMSASRGDSLKISRQDFNNALTLLTSTEKNMHKTFGGLGTAKHSNAVDKVLSYIRTVKATTRSTIMSRFYRDVDPDTLRMVEETGEQMKVLKITLLPEDRDKLYQWQEPTNPN